MNGVHSFSGLNLGRAFQSNNMGCCHNMQTRRQHENTIDKGQTNSSPSTIWLLYDPWGPNFAIANRTLQSNILSPTSATKEWAALLTRNQHVQCYSNHTVFIFGRMFAVFCGWQVFLWVPHHCPGSQAAHFDIPSKIATFLKEQHPKLKPDVVTVILREDHFCKMQSWSHLIQWNRSDTKGLPVVWKMCARAFREVIPVAEL